jgi:hypothetical protein
LERRGGYEPPPPRFRILQLSSWMTYRMSYGTWAAAARSVGIGITSAKLEEYCLPLRIALFPRFHFSHKRLSETLRPACALAACQIS